MGHDEKVKYKQKLHRMISEFGYNGHYKLPSKQSNNKSEFFGSLSVQLSAATSEWASSVTPTPNETEDESISMGRSDDDDDGCLD